MAVCFASQSFAAGTIVRDGATLQLGEVTYRLDGIDAPELDQICIDEHADPWACGVEARDQLTKTDRRPRRCIARISARPLQEAAYRHLHRRGRNRQLEPACRPPGICAEFRALRARAGSGRTRPAQKTIAAGFGKAALSRRRNSAGGQEGRRAAGRFLPGRQGSRNTRGAVPRGSRDAAGLQHQGQICRARPRHRESGRLSSAGMPQLPCPDQAGSLVLLRGRRPGRRLPQGLQLPGSRQPPM